VYATSLVVRGVSGQPYTPTITTGFGGGLEANSGRKPNGLRVDVRAERWLPFGPKLSVFGRVFNVFDTRIYNGFVFNDTGSPDYTRTPESSLSTLADPTRFFPPRRIELGLTANGILSGGR
jgi:hypothetical protein